LACRLRLAARPKWGNPTTAFDKSRGDSQMTRIKSFFAVLVLAATVALAPAAHAAATVHYIGAGSSAMFQGTLVAAVNDLAVNSPHIHHWSVKTSNGAGCAGTCAGLLDTRSGSIPVEFGNFWVAWSDDGAGNATDIWAYLSTDSTVGVRAIMARPTAQLLLAGTIGATAPGNVASPGLFQFGAPANGAAATCPSGFAANCDDTTLPADVIAALGGTTGTAITAGMTDIRPEDAKYATNRLLTAHSSEDTGAAGGAACGTTCRSFSLGYGPGPVGSPIKSGTGSSTAKATPVAFGLPGQPDPIVTTNTVPTTMTVIPVGEAPIVFLVNRSNTTNGLGQVLTGGSADGSYAARNLWDQHPYPPNGAPPSATPPPAGANTRRPLGNLFTGHDCATENAAFAWPIDQGQIVNPSTGAPPMISTKVGIHLFLREPLSGTMNTTEFTEFRIYGTTNGNGPTGNGQPALTSQEQLIDSVTDNPLKGKPCVGGAAGFGDRTRSIGTGEEVNGAGSATTLNGVLNTTDSIGYAFFSFSNVSKLATNLKFGYLMIDGIDPLFGDYKNTAGNAGQPATPGAPLTWGELPACDPVTGVPVFCKTNAIWTATASYPHLRDGTYPAWSELRLICDTADTRCATDTLGAKALIAKAQDDIHNNDAGGVPDFLPFSADGTFGPAGGAGDVSFIREHFAYQLSTGNPNTPPTSTHQSNPRVDFHLEPCSTGHVVPGTPVTAPITAECGGDAGGLIKPIGTTATGVLQ
jgi:hypothetical protein